MLGARAPLPISRSAAHSVGDCAPVVSVVLGDEECGWIAAPLRVRERSLAAQLHDAIAIRREIGSRKQLRAVDD